MSQRHGQFPPDARRLLVMMPGDPALSLDDATLDHLNQTKAQIVGLAIAAKTEPAKEQEHLARMDMKTGEFLRTAEVWLRRGGTVDKAEAAVTETMAVLREERAAEARENETLSASLVPGDDASPPRRQR